MIKLNELQMVILDRFDTVNHKSITFAEQYYNNKSFPSIAQVILIVEIQMCRRLTNIHVIARAVSTYSGRSDIGLAARLFSVWSSLMICASLTP